MRPLSRSLSVALLVGCLVAAVAVAEEQECDGPYKGRALSPEELATVLRNHEAWVEVYLRTTYLAWPESAIALHDQPRPNLCQADLQEANLRGANLLGANLLGANLRGPTCRGPTCWGPT